jgi:hypothetical protein
VLIAREKGKWMHDVRLELRIVGLDSAPGNSHLWNLYQNPNRA